MTKTFDLILLNCDAWYEPGRFERSAHDIPSSTYVRRHAGAASLPGHPASGSPRMIAPVDTVALVVVGMATPSRSGRSTSIRRRVLPSSPGAGCGASRFERRPGGSASPAHRRVDRQSTPFGSMAQVIFPGESGQVDYAAHVTFRTCCLSNSFGLRYSSDECNRYMSPSSLSAIW